MYLASSFEIQTYFQYKKSFVELKIFLPSNNLPTDKLAMAYFSPLLPKKKRLFLWYLSYWRIVNYISILTAVWQLYNIHRACHKSPVCLRRSRSLYMNKQRRTKQGRKLGSSSRKASKRGLTRPPFLTHHPKKVKVPNEMKAHLLYLALVQAWWITW